MFLAAVALVSACLQTKGLLAAERVVRLSVKVRGSRVKNLQSPHR
jgi:hypothetical protein